MKFDPIYWMAYGCAFIDSAIFRLCRTFAHWLQRMTGRTCYSVAVVGLWIEIASFVVDFMKPTHPELFPGNDSPWLLLSAGYILYDMFLWLVCRVNERRLYQMKPLFNMERVWLWRLFWVLTLIIGVGKFWASYPQPIIPLAIIDHATAVGSTIFVYFASVTPLPPGANKLQEWKEARALGRAMPSGAGA